MARQRLPEDVRKQEILNACDRLYQEKGFREITIKDISQETSFSRPSIYNYFETKEEIFLGLLTREYELWIGDLEEIAAGEISGSADLAVKIAQSLEKRKTLLKITSMNLYEIEENSRLERLMEFKRQFKRSMTAFLACVKATIPEMTEAELAKIRFAFFPFMYGIYPYAFPTGKQLEAMEREGIEVGKMSIRELTENLLNSVLAKGA